jgi:hypothetical protein
MSAIPETGLARVDRRGEKGNGKNHGPCSVCDGIWFWSEFSVGSLRCVTCSPPTKRLKIGPGIIQPDGSLLTRQSVTESIRQLAEAAGLISAREAVGPGWTHVRTLGVVVVPSLRQVVAPCRRCADVPCSVVIQPGDPDWVDRQVIDRAVARRRASKSAAKTINDHADGDLATRLSSRLKKKPRRNS